MCTITQFHYIISPLSSSCLPLMFNDLNEDITGYFIELCSSRRVVYDKIFSHLSLPVCFPIHHPCPVRDYRQAIEFETFSQLSLTPHSQRVQLCHPLPPVQHSRSGTDFGDIASTDLRADVGDQKHNAACHGEKKNPHCCYDVAFRAATPQVRLCWCLLIKVLTMKIKNTLLWGCWDLVMS